jgi:rare lipoprotein A
MINRYVFALCALLASCVHEQAGPPPGPVSYTIGNPYNAGGEWQYPRDFNSYSVTGLATVYGDDAPSYTADNEAYSADALAAASPVLQLPAIVTVTNLVNGQSVDVRVNDRGPQIPGRVLEVTPYVAQLLNFPSGGVVEVAVTLNVQETAALDGALGAGPKVSAAPVAGITAQSLGPPGSMAGSVQSLTPAATGSGASNTVTLSGTVSAGQPAPGPLYVQIPGFGSEYDAFRVMNRIYGMQARIVPQPGDSRTLYAVNVGPYHAVADADNALQQLLGLGIADPQIIVR